jgi:hypothetical protein
MDQASMASKRRRIPEHAVDIRLHKPGNSNDRSVDQAVG